MLLDLNLRLLRARYSNFLSPVIIRSLLFFSVNTDYKRKDVELWRASVKHKQQRSPRVPAPSLSLKDCPQRLPAIRDPWEPVTPVHPPARVPQDPNGRLTGKLLLWPWQRGKGLDFVPSRVQASSLCYQRYPSVSLLWPSD